MPAGFSCDEKDTAIKIFAGYQFNRNFAAEVAFQDFGKTKGSGTVLGVPVSAEVKSHAFEADALGILPFMDQFGAYGRLGLYYAKTEGSGVVGGATGSGSDTNSGLTYGLGLQWDPIRNVGLRLEWQRYHDVGGDNSGKGDIDVLGIAALYRFR
jgi:OOP family OmpA-OmpF porin